MHNILRKANKYIFFFFKLFRRVAAALPGMDSTENKPPEDSILLLKQIIIFQECFFLKHVTVK
jgi:hypothetical protein